MRADMNVKRAAAGKRILRGPNKELTKTTKIPLNIIAMLSAVGIQEASSKPRPRAPRRSGRPILTKRPFRVAIPAPRKTPKIPKYEWVVSCERTDGEEGAAALASK